MTTIADVNVRQIERVRPTPGEWGDAPVTIESIKGVTQSQADYLATVAGIAAREAGGAQARVETSFTKEFGTGIGIFHATIDAGRAGGFGDSRNVAAEAQRAITSAFEHRNDPRPAARPVDTSALATSKEPKPVRTNHDLPFRGHAGEVIARDINAGEFGDPYTRDWVIASHEPAGQSRTLENGLRRAREVADANDGRVALYADPDGTFRSHFGDPNYLADVEGIDFKPYPYPSKTHPDHVPVAIAVKDELNGRTLTFMNPLHPTAKEFIDAKGGAYAFVNSVPYTPKPEALDTASRGMMLLDDLVRLAK